MKIKRLLSIAVVGIMTVMALTGCTSGKDRNAKKTEQSLKSTQIETVEGNESKVLVVYYSASGNTKKAVEYIAAATGGDMFELVPTEVYSPSCQFPVPACFSSNLPLSPSPEDVDVANGITVLPEKSLSCTKLFTGHAAIPHQIG